MIESITNKPAHLTVESLTVKSPNAKGRIDMIATSGGTGLWVQSGNGVESIGLVALDEGSPYLVIYRDAQSFPPLAITDQGVQLSEGSVGNVTVIKFDDLLKAVRSVVAPEAV